MLPLLTDDDVLRITSSQAVNVMRSALADHHRMAVSAPARVSVDLGSGSLVFTVGRLHDRAYGFRVYGLFDPAAEQTTVVFDEATGRVLGVATGAELGDRRTGALGGVAVDVLARHDASVLAVIGTGRQAWTQVWGAAAVRRFAEIRVFGRHRGRREAFAARCTRELAVRAVATDHPRDAVIGADVVLLGTTSDSPVVEDGWITAGMHVSTVGPKTVERHECPPELAERAGTVVTDSPAQLAAYGAPPLVPVDAVVPLGAIVAGAAPGRTSSEEITLYLSTGLAGTEVALALAVLDSLDR